MKKSAKKVVDKNAEFFAAIELMEKEKEIPAQYIANNIADAISKAGKRAYYDADIVRCEINVEKKIFRIFLVKRVVDVVEDVCEELTVDQAREYKSDAQVGDIVQIDVDSSKFGRIVATSTKNVFRSSIKDAEKDIVLQEFQSKRGEIATATILNIDEKTGNATIEIGKGQTTLPKKEQIVGEVLHENQKVKVYVVDANKGEKDSKVRIFVSRTHPGLVRRLFENEVPEIFDGTVEIKSISRDAGSRTKIAVWSKDPDVDPRGACIGARGARVENIVEELGGEKIDIVKWSEDPREFIKEALSPAKVVDVEILDEQNKTCRASVPDHQLSLAIGNRGQNARLAVMLTGWKIDIRPESGYYGEEE